MSQLQYLTVGNLEGVLVASNVPDESADEQKLADFCKRICQKGLNLPKNENRVLQNGSTRYMVKVVELKSDASNRAIFICVTESETLSPKLVLRDYVAFFWKKIDESTFASASTDGALNAKAQPVFDQVIKKYGKDKVAETKGKIDQLKDQMSKNVKQQLDNMENLEETEARAMDLEENANKFKQTSTSLKWKMCCVNAKWTIILVVSICVILTIVVVIGVCMTDPEACKSN
uniref:V-SNARE coiled-coil homology domain-containing protein n=1 Tax=Lotharella globosa TaxID=91324 RepID=A0A7S3YMA2_9EUKA|mmetsp:Transcript_32754/g.63152  ORF Transcript_32754/g.63152 Transcript_32754/m.63152 type:complete len:232 (+) Transcript_32754:67-762(+)